MNPSEVWRPVTAANVRLDRTPARSYVRDMPGLARGSALSMAAFAAALLIPTAASADIGGRVATPRGAPLVDTGVTIRDSADRFVDFQDTDGTGHWTTKTSSLSGTTPPYTAKVSAFDSCDQSGTS